MNEPTPKQIAQNIDQVCAHIAEACARVGRQPDQVTLVGISKRKSPEAVLAAMEAGLQHLGENRVEEALEKIPQVNHRAEVPPTWHMVGHIQSRKAKEIPGLFQVVHSVDRMKIARGLSRQVQQQQGEAAGQGEALPVLLEVNISGEEAKFGFEAYGWAEQPAVFQRIKDAVAEAIALPGLDVRGLMTMAPFVDDMEQVRPVFASLARLRDALQRELDCALPELSMGMTNDYPVAIEEGATIVRVGRAIFGERDR